MTGDLPKAAFIHAAELTCDWGIGGYFGFRNVIFISMVYLVKALFF